MDRMFGLWDILFRTKLFHWINQVFSDDVHFCEASGRAEFWKKTHSVNCLLKCYSKDEPLLCVASRLFELWKYICYFKRLLNISVYCDVSKHSSTWKLLYKFAQIMRTQLHLLWCDLLCIFKAFLDLKVLSQRLQGMTIPSIWFASMWSFIAFHWPCFPQTLQI